MKQLLLILSLMVMSSSLMAQGTIKGVVKDRVTKETVPMANVVVKPGMGVVTDFDGNFSINVPNGQYNVVISYVGYLNDTIPVTVENNTVEIEPLMGSETLTEVEVTADVAISRETPIAFTNIEPRKLEEELAGREIPMLLNSTPGVYATNQGGGEGDARVNIRGFSQRNVAVMIDGIPVNDMENGWVYWSNWFGLNMVTRTTQVQRGLGASKLAQPSVGGTINILTTGMSSKKDLSVKQAITSEGKSTTQIGYSSGRLPGDWSVTAAGAYKYGNAYPEELYVKGWFYYLKVDKELGPHILSASVMGAPQEHSQRTDKQAIATFDKEYAMDLGVDAFPELYRGTDTLHYVNMGRRYNPHWGYIRRTRGNPGAPREVLHEKLNYYHKPFFTLRDFWTINEKMYMSNILYASIGHGGGTSFKGNTGVNTYDENYQIDWQSMYDANIGQDGGSFPKLPDSAGEYQSDQYLKSNINNHYMYGALSTLNYKYSEELDLSGGLDLRYYNGEHYAEVYDLLGGDYVMFSDLSNNHPNYGKKLRKGDKYDFYSDSYVRWGGLFTQAEYSTGPWSTFINITGAMNQFYKVDHFVLDTLGNEAESGKKTIPSYTTKGGANYNIDDHNNVFVNAGYMNKAWESANIYQGYTTEFRENIKNEQVKALELGYSFHAKKFSANVNTYLTYWENKFVRSLNIYYDSQPYSADMPGLDARHMGIETDFIYKITPRLDWQGFFSLGDWRWTTKLDNVRFFFTGTGTDLPDIYKNIDVKGVHVSDAAQTQLGTSLRYEIIEKKLYVMGKTVFFDRYFADFDPISTSNFEDKENIEGDIEAQDSWRIPAYYLVDFHAGYKFMLSDVRFDLRLNVLNVLDLNYISDARTNDPNINPSFKTYDAKASSVFFGAGRTFSISLKASFL